MTNKDDLIISKWDNNLYNQYIKYLFSIRDESLVDFNKKIVNTNQEIIGVRTPILRDIAKIISKGDIESFLQQVNNQYFEENLIEGFVIGYIKDEALFMKYFNHFIKHIDNWATCDTCVSSFKIMKKVDFFDIAKDLVFKDDEFLARVGIIIMLDHYIDKKHINEIIKIVSKLNSKYYYVNMAISWLISVLFIKFRTNTLELLKQRILPVFVQNKAIQKIRDSYRVSKEDKEMILLYKIN